MGEMSSRQMVVEFEPGRRGVTLMCSEVIDGILEDIWPRGIGGMIYDLLHPYRESGAVIFFECDSKRGIYRKGREESLRVRE